MIVRWPGVVRPGATADTPVHAVDILPTFFEMAGAAAPEGYPLDGASLVPLLEGRRLPGRELYWYMPFYDLRWGATPCAVIREGAYKLIEYFGDWVDLDTHRYQLGRRVELYHLERDPGERENLAPSAGRRVEAMTGKLHAWIRSCGAEVPQPNPRYDPGRALAETRDKTA
jgi:arylsulfatase A-like enzyme